MEVLLKVRNWLAQDQACFLCTVVKTWGSSPRPVGSLLTSDHRGSIVGSLSGGCVEDDLLEKLRVGQIARHGPELVQYGLDPADTERLGLPCGGSLHVLVEPLQPDSRTREVFETLHGYLQMRRCSLREVDLESGHMCLNTADRVLDLEYDESNARMRHYHGPKYQLFIIGAGMVSMYLAEIAQKLDYQVTLCDTREQLLVDWKIPGTRNLNMMPDDAIRQYASDAMSAIVALTHDPRIDDMGLMEALLTDAFYVGAMGSAKTSENRRLRLLELEVTEAQLAHLHAPIGLPIGSKTPPEIAIAIIAEITAVRKKCETVARSKLGALHQAA